METLFVAICSETTEDCYQHHETPWHLATGAAAESWSSSFTHLVEDMNEGQINAAHKLCRA